MAWHLEDGANSHVFDGRVVGGGVTIAFVQLGADSASLIAAAPELLEALQTTVIVLKAFGAMTGEKGWARDEIDAALGLAVPAIAKAAPPGLASAELDRRHSKSEAA